jgi:hypothetical protein
MEDTYAALIHPARRLAPQSGWRLPQPEHVAERIEHLAQPLTGHDRPRPPVRSRRAGSTWPPWRRRRRPSSTGPAVRTAVAARSQRAARVPVVFAIPPAAVGGTGSGGLGRGQTGADGGGHRDTSGVCTPPPVRAAGLVSVKKRSSRRCPELEEREPGRDGERGRHRAFRNRPALRDKDDDGPHGGTVGAVCRVAIETRSHCVLAGGFRGCSSRLRLIPRSGLTMEAR